MAGRVRSANGRRASNGNSSPRPSSSSATGDRKVIGQYMLGKTIGEGTFGKVKLAVHLPTGEKVNPLMLTYYIR
jgi:serine/threonine protein kinase